jgi:hypothetical protein
MAPQEEKSHWGLEAVSKHGSIVPRNSRSTDEAAVSVPDRVLDLNDLSELPTDDASS